MTRRETAAKHEMIKSLVVLYGPREAARQLGLSAGTVTELSHRKGWKQASASDPSADKPNGQSPQNTQPSNPIHPPVSDAIAAAQRSMKQRSVAALGQFVAEAAEEALQGKERLTKAKRVRDVAAIHTSLWPSENRPALLSVGILIGSIPVPDSQQPDRMPGMSSSSPELLADAELEPIHASETQLASAPELEP